MQGEGSSFLHPLILLTNDDGYQALGLQALACAVAPLGDLYVVAPDGARSGAAASITSTTPVSYSAKGDRVFACTGSPVDCVKLALEQIVPRTPDLILSGINHGDNASISVHYSGTMGAVIEGCMKEIPSIGISLWLQHGQRYDQHPVGDTTLQAIAQLCKDVLAQGLPQDVCLNVNLPATEHFRGWKVCRQARGRWSAEWATATNPHGLNAFWLTGKFTDLEPEATDTDFAALREGYASIVPITVDMTDHQAIHHLRAMLT